jgi:hypothetical protein
LLIEIDRCASQAGRRERIRNGGLTHRRRKTRRGLARREKRSCRANTVAELREALPGNGIAKRQAPCYLMNRIVRMLLHPLDDFHSCLNGGILDGERNSIN